MPDSMTCVQIEDSNEMGTEVDNKGHYHLEDGPTHFCKVILAPKLECIPMPLDFTKHFVTVPTEFKLRNNTGCFWKVTIKMTKAG